MKKGFAADLVAYEHKHNDANGEENRDGENNNNSWNCGVEGKTDDVDILKLRARQRRNFMATLFISQGVPMIGAGDEIGRTQQGNNNAYCQDNEVSWVDWDLGEEGREFLDFTRRVIRLWNGQPALQRRKFFQGRPIRGSEVKDLVWLEPAGGEMGDDAWNAPHVRTLGMRLAGESGEVDEEGREIKGDTLLVLINAHHVVVPFSLPDEGPEQKWVQILDSWDPGGPADAYPGGSAFSLQGRAISVFRLCRSS